MNIPWITFPAEGLSQQSLMSIIQLLAEDLRLANQEIIELRKTNVFSCHDKVSTDQLQLTSESSTAFENYEENLQGNLVECNWVCSENQSPEPTKQKDTLDQYNLATPVFPEFTTEDVRKINCGYCDSRHKKGKEFCPAWNKMCRKCHRINHFASACKTKEENYLKRNRSKSSAQETIGREINSEEKNDRFSECEWKKVEKSRTFRRYKSESDLRTLRTSVSNDVVLVRKDKPVANDIPRNSAGKYRQENETETCQRPCLWCSRKTKYSCIKCTKVYCSRRCTFSDQMHSNDCNYGYFCAHCAENGGYCDIHKAPSEKFQENEPEPDDEK